MSNDLLRSIASNLGPVQETNELGNAAAPATVSEPQPITSGISGMPDSIEPSSGQNFFSQQADGIIWQNQSPYVMSHGNLNLDGDVATVDIGGEAFTPVPSEFTPPEGDPLPGLDDPDPIGGDIANVIDEVGDTADEPLDWNDIISGRTTHKDEATDQDLINMTEKWYMDRIPPEQRDSYNTMPAKGSAEWWEMQIATGFLPYGFLGI
jgi:hypothetical protein